MAAMPKRLPSREQVEMGKHGAKVGSFACPICAQPFERYLCEVRKHPPTCSMACNVTMWPRKPRLRVALRCEVCDSQFEVLRFRSSGKRKARFCSDACKNSAQRGVGHPGWKGGVSERASATRKVIAERVAEAGQCEKCGATGGLHGHHIKPHATHPELRDDPANIMVLCGPCHALEHPNFAAALVRPAIRTGALIDCPECGEPFYVKPSHVGRRRYCSRRCSTLNWHALRAA